MNAAAPLPPSTVAMSPPCSACATQCGVESDSAMRDRSPCRVSSCPSTPGCTLPAAMSRCRCASESGASEACWVARRAKPAALASSPQSEKSRRGAQRRAMRMEFVRLALSDSIASSSSSSSPPSYSPATHQPPGGRLLGVGLICTELVQIIDRGPWRGRRRGSIQISSPTRGRRWRGFCTRPRCY